MKRAGVIAAVVVATGAVAAVVVLALGDEGEPSGPRPPARSALGDELDASDGEADTAAAPAADAEGGKRLLGEVVESWPDPDTIDNDPAAPISDEEWAVNPCKPLGEMIIGTTPATSEAIAAQISEARAHHRQNSMIDQLTWTYAGCLAIQKNDLSLCQTTPGVAMPQRCEDDLLVYRLATAKDAAQCEKDVAGFMEAKRDRLLLRQVCRAATGDPDGCKNFRHPAWRWYCDLLQSPDPKRCEGIEDRETRAECPSLAVFVRAARKLPPAPGIELSPEMPLAVMTRVLTEPDFDCAAWFRGALRSTCR